MSKTLYRAPDWTQVLRAIGKVTFSEITRDRLLYNCILTAIFLLMAGLLASKLSYSNEVRIVLDFGMLAVDLASALTAVLVGATLIGKEYERRTAFVILSKPISRFQFLAGKYVGAVAVMAVNWFLLSAALIGVYLSVGGELSVILFAGLFLVLLKTLLILTLSIFFSTFSTASLSVILTFGFYMIGTNISQVQFVASRVKWTIGRFLLDSVTYIFPDLERFGLGLQITYGLPTDWDYVMGCVLYMIFYSAMLLFFASILINRKEI